MKLARIIAATVATGAVSLGLLGISAPAHADFSWGFKVKTSVAK
ncbi:MAG: hypothetical protein QM572_10575 [Nocardioides sp.]